MLGPTDQMYLIMSTEQVFKTVIEIFDATENCII